MLIGYADCASVLACHAISMCHVLIITHSFPFLILLVFHVKDLHDALCETQC